MRLKVWLPCCAVCLLLFHAFCASATGATVKTRQGYHHGRVIVRKTPDRLVVTILTQEKRLFQFYARDIVSITASQKVLIGKNAKLYPGPNESLPLIRVLSRGNEVTILEEIKPPSTPNSLSKDSTSASSTTSWIKIQAWGNVMGWTSSSMLADHVEFTSEEKTIPYETIPADESIQPASPK